MQTYARIFLTIVSALAWAGCTNAPAVSQADAVRAQTFAPAKNARVQTVSFQSRLVGKTLPYNVVLPVSYDQPSARATRYPVLYLLHGLTGHYDNWTMRTLFGDEGSATRAANDLPKLYRELPAEQIAALPYIYLDCGTEDHLLASNRSFVAILVTKKIPHEYRELPGGHSWEYWDARVQEVLKVAIAKMRQRS